uniref:Uncharacterized protein n=1 Tax=Anopheles farauti TaxID=69004 RepID=A0A182QLY8_9DIPT
MSCAQKNVPPSGFSTNVWLYACGGSSSHCNRPSTLIRTPPSNIGCESTALLQNLRCTLYLLPFERHEGEFRVVEVHQAGSLGGIIEQRVVLRHETFADLFVLWINSHDDVGAAAAVSSRFRNCPGPGEMYEMAILESQKHTLQIVTYAALRVTRKRMPRIPSAEEHSKIAAPKVDSAPGQD